MTLPNYDNITDAELGILSHDRPSTFIQWKGTDVCVDVYCGCGEQFHVDGFFAYVVQCPHCGAFYHMSTRVKLTQIAEPDHGMVIVGA